jgi:hypothetical protein
MMSEDWLKNQLPSTCSKGYIVWAFFLISAKYFQYVAAFHKNL